ncbi:hypothetical protein M622_05420 [Thauera terpenica 58Eu]|uniref:Uncharacterized protein n=1 Tax=Thauera terpenica 58Eu TaxID=1348657 RepID=S9ZAV2_9RHOO|nr:hypothetical protein M622_05420 [Thauera terpenica 58Eu]
MVCLGVLKEGSEGPARRAAVGSDRVGRRSFRVAT